MTAAQKAPWIRLSKEALRNNQTLANLQQNNTSQTSIARLNASAKRKKNIVSTAKANSKPSKTKARTVTKKATKSGKVAKKMTVKKSTKAVKVGDFTMEEILRVIVLAIAPFHSKVQPC